MPILSAMSGNPLRQPTFPRVSFVLSSRAATLVPQPIHSLAETSISARRCRHQTFYASLHAPHHPSQLRGSTERLRPFLTSPRRDRHGSEQTGLPSSPTKSKHELLRYFGVGALAHAFLLPSGTDALLTTAMLLASERPNKALTAILPAASETGTGVPMAAVCRLFDGASRGTPLTECSGKAVQIPLRLANGLPRSDDDVNDAFAAATTAAAGSAVVYLTHGTKTGLIAPVAPPYGADVIVDACQARIAPATVEAYLRRGWPVVVTGSKFFGGPAFSGAVFFPRARLSAVGRNMLPRALRVPPGLGTTLRWVAALTTIDAFESSGGEHSGKPLLSGRLHRSGVRLQSCPGINRRPVTERLGVGGPAQHFHLRSARSNGSRQAVVGGRTAAAL